MRKSSVAIELGKDRITEDENQSATQPDHQRDEEPASPIPVFPKDDRKTKSARKPVPYQAEQAIKDNDDPSVHQTQNNDRDFCFRHRDASKSGQLIQEKCVDQKGTYCINDQHGKKYSTLFAVHFFSYSGFNNIEKNGIA